ncbi:X intrinsic protein [Striga asiatica]|uniref:X intrinsic protein n=1 Tax=Striga asiatica TaxID=4170 RepID=A0A5A7PSR4_STRAF|nr:X intrinsic protein [Striga asiatica]
MLDTIVISTIESDVKMPNLILSALAAIIISILLLAVHPISGGHINPIISFSAGLVGIISMSRAFVYILAQCLGGVLGALALKAVVSSSIEQTFSLGGCTLTVVAPGANGPIIIGLGTAQALWLEIFCSFIFLFASIWMAYDHRQAKELGHVLVFVIVGIVLGLLVFVSSTVTAQKGYVGAGMNPARCIGPAIVRGGHLWDGHWVFWAGPGIACVAFYLYTKIIPSQHHRAKAYDHDFYNVVKIFILWMMKNLKILEPRFSLSPQLQGKAQNWTTEPEKNHQQSPILSEMLGLNELFSLDVWRASIGELLGTAVLVFMLDTIAISTIEPDIKMSSLIQSVLAAITTSILLLAVHPISGGHINPIISFSAGLVGIISMTRGLVYITAQCLGGVLGALALKGIVSSSVEQTLSLRGCTITAIGQGPNGPDPIGLGTAQALWLEIVCGFIFLFASIWMAYDHRQVEELGRVLVFVIVGMVSGLLMFVTSGLMAQNGYVGPGMNPAMCFGAAVVRGGHLWDGHWVFWAGPGIACVAFYLYTKIIPGQHYRAKAYDHDFYNVVKVMFGTR